MRAENSQESAEMQRRKLTGIGRNVVKKITGREEAGMDEREYYERLSAAYLRGRAGRIGQSSTEEEEPKLYPFKRGHRELPRVRKVLGFLHAVQPESLLDVGSGRGVFLFPFLEEFPETETVSIDVLPRRVEFLQDVNRGGITRLRAVQADLCGQPFPDGSFDVVTALEVLEHIPDVESAVRAAVRMARRYVVVTVPSKPDDNPEHIHLLTKERLAELFEAAGCRRLHFDGVPGHLFVAAPLGKEG